MADTPDRIGEEVMDEFGRAASNRGNWETHWQEIAERVFPMHVDTFYSHNKNASEVYTPGRKKRDLVFDSTAARALNKFSAILDSLLTPRNQTWHRLVSSEPTLNKDRQVRLWFEEVNRLLFKYRYAPSANFASQNQMTYKSLGAYGTGATFIDTLDDETIGFRYKHIHLGDLYFMENHQGIIDRVFRRFHMTARQAMQKFGDALPDQIKEKAKTRPEDIFYFVHRVSVNKNRDPERLDSRGKRYLSHYVSEVGKKAVQEGGYNSFPYSVSRYEQAPNEVYGRSPAMEVLPEIKTANEQKKTMLKQGHRAVDPVLLAHDDGIIDTFSLKPGAINAGGVDKNGRAMVQALPVGSLAAGQELLNDERAAINEAFLVTLFQILVDTPQMTATEVLERTKEKGMLIAPTSGRLQSEYLGPLIERELSLAIELGLVSPPPPALVEAQGEYRIEYDSPLSRAQRAEEASGILRSVETALQIVNVTQSPEPLDHFNWDVIIPEISSIQGVPASWMRDPQVIQQMRESRAEQAQVEQAIQAGPSVAAVAKAANQ